MNDDHIKDIFARLNDDQPPPDITNLADQAAQGFIKAITLLQAARPQSPHRMLLKYAAVAASITAALAAGIIAGRVSVTYPPHTPVAEATPDPVYTVADGHTPSFWQQKALDSLRTAGLTRIDEQTLRERLNLNLGEPR